MPKYPVEFPIFKIEKVQVPKGKKFKIVKYTRNDKKNPQIYQKVQFFKKEKQPRFNKDPIVRTGDDFEDMLAYNPRSSQKYNRSVWLKKVFTNAPQKDFFARLIEKHTNHREMHEGVFDQVFEDLARGKGLKKILSQFGEVDVSQNEIDEQEELFREAAIQFQNDMGNDMENGMQPVNKADTFMEDFDAVDE